MTTDIPFNEAPEGASAAEGSYVLQAKGVGLCGPTDGGGADGPVYATCRAPEPLYRGSWMGERPLGPSVS